MLFDNWAWKNLFSLFSSSLFLSQERNILPKIKYGITKPMMTGFQNKNTWLTNSLQLYQSKNRMAKESRMRMNRIHTLRLALFLMACIIRYNVSSRIEYYCRGNSLLWSARFPHWHSQLPPLSSWIYSPTALPARKTSWVFNFAAARMLCAPRLNWSLSCIRFLAGILESAITDHRGE